MGFVPTVSTVRVAMNYTYFGKACINTYWVGGTGVLTTTDADAIAAAFADWWNDDLRPIQSDSLSLDAVVVRDQQAPDSFEVTYTTGLPLLGAVTSDGLPGSVALCVTRLSGLTGRANRGRVYILGISEASVTGNQVSSTFRDAVVDAHDDLNNRLALLSYYSETVSLRDAGADRVAGLRHGVTAWRADLRVDSQRRRLGTP